MRLAEERERERKLTLKATVGTTSSLNWPEDKTLTNEVLPLAYPTITTHR
jgi:hypothetical protein